MLRRLVFTFAVVANLVLLDQIVKAAAVFYLKARSAIVVIEGLFNLAYVENRGCAWGMLQGQVWPLAVFAVAALVVLFWKRSIIFPTGKIGTLCEYLLYGGIVGNLLDRISRGCVVDMFDVYYGIHHFPCFNVADSYITVAAIILIAYGFLQKKPKEMKGDEANGDA